MRRTSGSTLRAASGATVTRNVGSGEMKTDITWGGITYWAMFMIATLVLGVLDIFAFRRNMVLGLVAFVPTVSIVVLLQQVGIRLFGERTLEILIGIAIGLTLLIGSLIVRNELRSQQNAGAYSPKAADGLRGNAQR